METPVKNTLVFELADYVVRSWSVVVCGTCLGLAAATGALHYLPKSYEAVTKILVAPPRLSKEFVRSTINDDLAIRLASLREAVLSRPYMMRLLEQLDRAPISPADAERRIRELRSKVDVQVIKLGDNRENGSGLFTITFRDSNAERAADTVNFLADFYIQVNSKFRATRSEENTATLEGLQKDVQVQLDEKERNIGAFKSLHLFESQDHLQANLQLIASRQQDLDNLDRQIVQLQDKIQTIQAQSAQLDASSSSTLPSDGVVDPYSSRLTRLQNEIAQLRLRYSERHPEVIAKQRELDDLLANGPPLATGGDAGEVSSTVALNPMQIQIRAAERDIRQMRTQQETIRREIALFNRRVENTPRVEAQLQELSKGYDTLKTQYAALTDKVQTAKSAQTIEQNQQGEQFEIMERGIAPAVPVQPNPMVVLATGLFLGIGLFLGPGITKRLLSPAVSSEAAVRAMTEIPILVSIPRLETKEVVAVRHRRRAREVTASIASFAVLVVVVLFFH